MSASNQNAIPSSSSSSLKPMNNEGFEDEPEVDELDDALFDKDRRQLLQFLPDEVWQLITEAKNIHSTDLTQLSNSSPYFRKLLWRKRVLFLFPNIWNIYWARRPMSETFGNEILPFRLICKSWCNVINNFQDRIHCHFKMEHDDEHARHRDEVYRRSSVVEFSQFSAAFMERFLEHFAATHAKEDGNSVNPFMGRSIEIVYFNDRDFFQRLKTVLAIYGKHVWYCSVLGSGIGAFPPGMYYQKFRDYLELMPNLKCFKLHHHPSHDDSNPDSTQSLVEAMQQNPLPVLQNLQFFTARYLPAVMFNQFMVQHNQVKCLEVGHRVSDNQNQIQLPEMPNLEKFSLKCYGLEDYQLLQNRLSSCKLTTLHLDLEKCEHMEWTGIFSVLETNWASTLKDLMLSFPRAASETDQNKILREYSLSPLNLPVVSRLKLILRNVCCLDFIMPMQQNLESLYISILWDMRDVQSQALNKQGQSLQTIQFLGSFEEFIYPHKKIYKSNVWNLFPKLKRFDIWDHFKYWRYVMEEVLRRHNFEELSYRGATREEWREYNGLPEHSK